MEISKTLINWYSYHKRDLPWRSASDPYIIWVSEIILQQTRVDQGMEYFIKFIARFPDVFSLATANEQEVLKYWQGLGYYSRARNMHSAAKTVVEEMNGVFPVKFEELLKLKGIGNYTASAIASICFNEPCPVVDGNVMRVIARYFGITLAVNTPEAQKLIYETCNSIIDRTQPGEFNQAIMEFGALQCTPRNTQCISCPLQPGCEAYRTGRVESLPLKLKPARPRIRYFYYLLIQHEDKEGVQSIYMKKRAGKDIWKGLFELPLIESPAASEPDELYGSVDWKAIFNQQHVEIIEFSNEYKHLLSHQTIFARFVSLRIEGPLEGTNSWQQVSFSHVHEFPIPRLVDKYLKQHKIL
jgi:A/G-specific adenine glycosylase